MLLQRDARPVSGAERYTELSTANLIQRARVMVPDALNYLPDDPQPEKCDRCYLMTILNTLDPGSIDQLRIQAINRSKNQPAGNRENHIQLADEFRDIINNPLFPLGSLALLRQQYATAWHVSSQTSESTAEVRQLIVAFLRNWSRKTKKLLKQRNVLYLTKNCN